MLKISNLTANIEDRNILTGLNLTIKPGEVHAIMGPNGSGKTTLLRLMTGALEPDAGTVKRAVDLRVVTFSQHRGTLDPNDQLSAALGAKDDMVDYRGKMIHVAGWAKRFLFEPDQLSTKVKLLSGGEQARVLIANLMLQPADVLLLDEPTSGVSLTGSWRMLSLLGWRSLARRGSRCRRRSLQRRRTSPQDSPHTRPGPYCGWRSGPVCTGSKTEWFDRSTHRARTLAWAWATEPK